MNIKWDGPIRNVKTGPKRVGRVLVEQSWRVQAGPSVAGVREARAGGAGLRTHSSDRSRDLLGGFETGCVPPRL